MYKRKNIFLLINFVLLFFLVIRGSYLYKTLGKKKTGFEDLYNNKIEVRGTVCSEAELDYHFRRFVVCNEKKILVTTSLYPEYNYGDVLLIQGLLQEPNNFSDFDYKKYLAGKGIYALFYYPNIQYFENSNLSFSSRLMKGVYGVKWKLKKAINKGLPEPEAGLANALLLGYKKALYVDDREAFSKAGLSHLIVISGAHVTILSSLILSFFIFLGLSKKASLRFVFLFLFTYPFLVGLSSSSVRASIMGALLFIAYYYGRLSNMLNAVVFAANIMLLFRPLSLFIDVGFQLSFAAVLGIMYIYPLGRQITKKLKEIKINNLNKLSYFWDAFSLTLACQVAVFPIIAYHFQSFSSLSFLANPLIAWILYPLIATLVVSLLLSLVFQGLAFIIFIPAYFLLFIFQRFAYFVASFSNLYFSISNFGVKEVFLYYFCLIFILSWMYRKKKRKYSRRKNKKYNKLKKTKIRLK